MAKKNGGIITKITRFFKQVKNEMKKTNWPNREELKSNTMIVLLTCIALIAFLGIVDVILTGILTPLLT